MPLTSSTLPWCTVVSSISRAQTTKNSLSSLRQVASCKQNMMLFHAISLPAPILKAFHIRSPREVNSKLCSALKLGIFFNFRVINLSFVQNTPAVVPRLSSGIKSCRKYPYRAVVPKNFISQCQLPDDFRHLEGPQRDCCCDKNPLRLILGTPL